MYDKHQKQEPMNNRLLTWASTWNTLNIFSWIKIKQKGSNFIWALRQCHNLFITISNKLMVLHFKMLFLSVVMILYWRPFNSRLKYFIVFIYIVQVKWATGNIYSTLKWYFKNCNQKPNRWYISKYTFLKQCLLSNKCA